MIILTGAFEQRAAISVQKREIATPERTINLLDSLSSKVYQQNSATNQIIKSYEK
ncbi:hypothetical protein D3C71_2159580 [compost metagenome]